MTNVVKRKVKRKRNTIWMVEGWYFFKTPESEMLAAILKLALPHPVLNTWDCS
jgi:hypothetical protein